MAGKQWMIYGATGYSGKLIAELAVQNNYTPILAGRDKQKLESLGNELGLAWRAFNIVDASQHLADMELVLNCAGPFSKTYQPFLAACLETKTHYLDITGEIDVFEGVFAQSAKAKAKGIAFIPGVGFDVVPTDCLACLLKAALPDAGELHLAFYSAGKLSPGTVKTAIESLHQPLRIRRGGKLVSAPTPIQREAQFPAGSKTVTAIPWGDLSTAYHSTGIKNVTTYTTLPKVMPWLQKISQTAQKAVGQEKVENVLKNLATKFVHGPSVEERAKSRVQLWGMVKNKKAATVQANFSVPDGYAFTAAAALESSVRMLRGINSVGALTPASAFGADFVKTLPNVEVSEIHFF